MPGFVSIPRGGLLCGAAAALALLVGAQGAAQRAPEPAAAPPPVVLSVRSLGLGAFGAGTVESEVGSAALSPDARRLYVGLAVSHRLDRRNLAVIPLDAQAKPSGQAQRYRDGELALPEGANATVTTLLPDPVRRKLYLGVSHTAAQPVALSRLLTVWDLDAAGTPIGAPRSYECGNPQRSLTALARHPRLDRLYLVGWGGPAVYVQDLNPQGEPVGPPRAFPVGGAGKYEVAVSPDGRRLYLGAYPDRVEVLDLDARGYPTGAPRTFEAAPPDPKTSDYLRFQYTPEALYVRRPGPDGERLATWPLDGNGYPLGMPRLVSEQPMRVVIADPERGRVWGLRELSVRDAFTGKMEPVGVEVTAVRGGTGALPAGTPASTVAGETGAAAAVAANGRVVLLTRPGKRAGALNRSRGYRVRVTLLEVRLRSGGTPNSVPGWLKFGDTLLPLGELTRGRPSAWVELDTYLKGQTAQVLARLSTVVAQPSLDARTPNLPVLLRVQLEVARGESAPGRVVKTLTESVQGEGMMLFFPGLASGSEEEQTAQIELFSTSAQRYRQRALAAAIPPAERPRLFPVSCTHLLGGQGHVGQLKAQAETLGMLGFNTVNTYWWGAIPPSEIDGILDGAGLTRRALAGYRPPSYFAFDRDLMSPAALDRWAAAQVASLGPASGGGPRDFVQMFLSDEPAWYYPGWITDVRQDAGRLAAFRAFLTEKGRKPADFGAARWDQVFPGQLSAARDLPGRRLHYWTARFFAESAARGHRLAREALERQAGHPLLTPVNWNNWVSRWYVPSPHRSLGNNPSVGPDTAQGTFDWLLSGRLDAHSPWTEDWFRDAQAQTWSFYADALRSSAQLGRQQFGGYVIGSTLGDHPAGATYRILSLLGHGAKALDVYSFGPEWLFGGNCWSETVQAYRPIAEALRLVGRSERLLYPGRPARGKVALFLPGSSGLWDPDAEFPHYFQDLWPLHFALVHGGYTVDFVDETDLLEGALAKRGYTTLFLTGPNLPVAAGEALEQWVAGGGTLVVSPGAGTADEYNTPADSLASLLGVRPRRAVRDASPNETGWSYQRPSGRLTGLDRDFGGTGLSVYGPLALLQPTGAETLASLADGRPVLTRRRAGKGSAYAYGFFPGWQYWITPDRLGAGLPRDWGAPERKLILTPVRLANTPRPVLVDREGVEACRLDSAAGTAIVLLNWTDVPIESLTVTLPEGGPESVTSARRSPVRAEKRGAALRITLPLRDVDVLLIEGNR